MGCFLIWEERGKEDGSHGSEGNFYGIQGDCTIVGGAALKKVFAAGGSLTLQWMVDNVKGEGGDGNIQPCPDNCDRRGCLGTLMPVPPSGGNGGSEKGRNGVQGPGSLPIACDWSGSTSVTLVGDMPPGSHWRGILHCCSCLLGEHELGLHAGMTQGLLVPMIDRWGH